MGLPRWIVPASRTDDQALKRLLRRQKGLLTAAQAAEVGISASALTRRVAAKGNGWRRILPRVYATFDHSLTEADKVRAAVLYAGQGACLTGSAALRWHRIPHLPHEFRTLPVDVLVPHARQVADVDWVRITRTTRPSDSVSVDGVRTVYVARAAIDAGLRLTSYDATLALLAAVINAELVSSGQLAAQLLSAPVRGSLHLRNAMRELRFGTRSVPEAQARQVFADAGLPEPEVNVPIRIDGRILIPDFRWGRVILEVESREFHLMVPGSWERTQRRWAALSAAGYLVIPATPEDILRRPASVVAAIRGAMAALGQN